MRNQLKYIVVISILLSVIVLGQPPGSNEPSNKEIKKLADKWLTIKNWTASYKESYTSIKSWEMRPGVTMKTTIKSTISGTFTLDSLVSDGQYYGEWYGFGSGSSISDQIVTMTSSGPDGEITITEKTNTVGSGAIGTTENNEYGENWGGGFSIDIYSGTYSFGFGGPDADGKATFTRTVEGLPTDYSKLEKLPEGLKEIFVPLGEKAEEWATYDGPLEDAQGMMVGGFAGFELFPDMDEPTEYPLPKSSKVLKGSYTGKSITKNWTISPGSAIEPLYLEKTPVKWIPNPEEQDPVTITTSGDGWQGEKARMRFTLFEVTREIGFCMNSQNDTTSLDLEFNPSSSKTQLKKPEETEDGWIIETSGKVMSASIDVIAKDFGAWGKLKAEVQVDEEEDIWNLIQVREGSELKSTSVEEYITIPLDEMHDEEDRIADFYEIMVGYDLHPLNDEEGDNNQGDGLTDYEEYRGFMIGGDGGYHSRTNPVHTVDLFVHCESPELQAKIEGWLKVYNADIEVTLLGQESDYVDKETRVINPNRGEYTLGEQHGIRMVDEDIPKPFVLGRARGRMSSPGTTDRVILDVSEFTRLNQPNAKYREVAVHELMHGCSVKHHGASNIKREFEGKTYSMAYWDGVNAGDVTCVMQYGWGDLFYLENGDVAADELDNPIPFIDTKQLIKTHYLCTSKSGVDQAKSPQLGSAKNGACLSQAKIADN